MATDPPANLSLAPLRGEPRSVAEWVTTFHLAVVVLDPFTYESAWLLEEASRILDTYTAADVRVGWIVTSSAAEAKQFLGPWADRFLTFTDPDREIVKALGLGQLPAFVHIDMGCHVASVAEGWHPEQWREALAELSRTLSWSQPAVPGPKAPGPFPGSPALATSSS